MARFYNDKRSRGDKHMSRDNIWNVRHLLLEFTRQYHVILDYLLQLHLLEFRKVQNKQHNARRLADLWRQPEKYIHIYILSTLN
jgi:hypothetical protein